MLSAIFLSNSFIGFTIHDVGLMALKDDSSLADFSSFRRGYIIAKRHACGYTEVLKEIFHDLQANYFSDGTQLLHVQQLPCASSYFSLL